MDSWIYIFSQFTPEALVLELSLIFILCGSYAVFWILRKRRYGVVDQVMPIGPVKAYLNQLIGNADHLRTQLFGLLNREGGLGGTGLSTSLSGNSDLEKILVNLETKLDAQGKTLEHLTANGVPARVGSAVVPVTSATSEPSSEVAAGLPDPASLAEVNLLKDKVDHLETRLAEYSIIEDDLANLKRIQQENAELRAAVMNQNGGAPPVITPTAAAAPAPQGSESDARAAAPAPQAAPEPVVELPQGEASPLVAEPLAEPVAEPAAESLVKPVVAAPEQPAEPAAPSGVRTPTEMGEDDLVKEFEKMLQG